MEQQRFPEDQKELSSSSEMRWKVQNQLYAFIIGRFEDDFEGHHAELHEMTTHENAYAVFLIGEISEKFASWFDTLAMTVKSFAEKYYGQPQKVLEALIGSDNVEQYLRDLEERFKVTFAPDESLEMHERWQSIIRVNLLAYETRQQLSKILDSSAKSA